MRARFILYLFLISVSCKSQTTGPAVFQIKKYQYQEHIRSLGEAINLLGIKLLPQKSDPSNLSNLLTMELGRCVITYVLNGITQSITISSGSTTKKEIMNFSKHPKGTRFYMENIRVLDATHQMIQLPNLIGIK